MSVARSVLAWRVGFAPWLLCGFTFAAPARAENNFEVTPDGTCHPLFGTSHEEPCHGGFFFELSVHNGWLWTDSNHSASNGYQQPIPSTSSGFIAPGVSVLVGGTLGRGLALAFSFRQLPSTGPTVEVKGERLDFEELRLQVVAAGLTARWYPNVERGLYFAAMPAMAAINAKRVDYEYGYDSGTSIGRRIRGGFFSVGAGWDLWLFRSIGVGPSVHLAYFSSFEPSGTTAWAPTFALGATWY